MARWIIHCSKTYFQPMYEYFEKQLKKRKFLMMDETRLQVLKEEGRRAQTQSFIWVVRSGEDGLPKIVLYHYTETRAGKHAVGFLDGIKPGYYIYGRRLSWIQSVEGWKTLLLLCAYSQISSRSDSERT